MNEASPDHKTAVGKIEVVGEARMLALGGQLCALAEPGDVLALRGDLGAGKTVLARGFVRAGMGAALDDQGFDVPSPTFTLVQVYDASEFSIWHFDLYRLERADEIWELGFEEALDDGVCLIEWPEHAGGLLPDNRLDITISSTASESARLVELRGGNSWKERLAHVK